MDTYAEDKEHPSITAEEDNAQDSGVSDARKPILPRRRLATLYDAVAGKLPPHRGGKKNMKMQPRANPSSREINMMQEGLPKTRLSEMRYHIRKTHMGTPTDGRNGNAKLPGTLLVAHQ